MSKSFFYYSTCFLFILIFFSLVNAEPAHQTYTTEQGLPSTFIKHITRLPDGEIVISSDNGLSFFDGYEFHNRNINHGLPDNFIKQTLVDSQNRLLVATDNGLGVTVLNGEIPESFHVIPFNAPDEDRRIRHLYEMRDGSILVAGQNIIYRLDDQDQFEEIPFDFELSYQSNFVRSFYFQEDSMGGVLIPSAGNNLLYLSPQNNSIQRVPDSGLPDELRSIEPIGDGRYLIGSTEGLYLFNWNPDLQKVTHASLIEHETPLEIDAIKKHQDHIYTLGTVGSGLLRFDLTTLSITPYREFFSNYIKHIYLDHSHNQWISTDYGLVMIPNMPFGNIDQEEGIPRRFITGITRDHLDHLWVSTHEGLFLRKQENEPFQKIRFLEDHFVNIIYHCRDSLKLYAFSPQEIHQYDPETREGETIHTFDESIDIVDGIHDDLGNIWVIDSNRSQLIKYATTNQSAKRMGPADGITEPISSITRTSDNTIWIAGSNRFVARYNAEEGQFEPLNWQIFPHAPEPNEHLSYIGEGADYQLWIGSTNGVYAINPTPETMYQSTQWPLDVTGVNWIKSAGGNIWVGTNRELYMLKTANGEIDGARHFSPVNGLNSTSFNYGSAYVDDHGYLWMGTSVGVSYYNGGDIIMQSSPVHLRKWQVGDNVYTTNEERVFDHDTNHMTFSFSTLDYPSEDVTYQIRVQGRDGSWSAPTQNPAFTQFFYGSGHYEVDVRASRSSTIWTEPLTIRFVIKRPWWFSNIMIAIYGLTVLGFIFAFVSWRSRALRQRNKLLADGIRQRTEHLTDIVKKLEKEIQQRKEVEKKLQNSNQTKERLIKIISHDLRSPFQGIVGYASLLQDHFYEFGNEERLDMIGRIVNSSNRAVTLLDQLLEWVTFESGKMRFKADYHNLNTLVKEMVDLLESMAKNKKIDIQNDIPENFEVYGDKNMLQTILRNLLSNALKFTDANGCITINAQEKDEYKEVSIIDNGVGMEQESLDSILSGKKTMSKKGTQKEGGTGLGLIMIKEMIERHGGKLSGKSIKGEGTRFTFSLPDKS